MYLSYLSYLLHLSIHLSIFVYVLMGKKGEKLWPSVRLCLHTCKLAMVWYHQNRRDVMK